MLVVNNIDIFFKNREDLQSLISAGYVCDEEIGNKLFKDIANELGLK